MWQACACQGCWQGGRTGWVAEPLLAPETYQAPSAPVTLSDLTLVSHVHRTCWEPALGGWGLVNSAPSLVPHPCDLGPVTFHFPIIKLGRLIFDEAVVGDSGG